VNWEQRKILECADNGGALDTSIRSKAASRYDHPSAAAALGTPVACRRTPRS